MSNLIPQRAPITSRLEVERLKKGMHLLGIIQIEGHSNFPGELVGMLEPKEGGSRSRLAGSSWQRPSASGPLRKRLV